VTPRSGPTTGGTAITISGSNLPSRAYVWVGGQPAPVVASGPDSITATTSAHAVAGTYDVEVVAPDGTGDVLRAAFTYVAEEGGQPPPPSEPPPPPPPGDTPPPTTPPPPQVRQLANGLRVKVLPEGSPLAAFRPAATCAAPTCRATLI